MRIILASRVQTPLDFQAKINQGMIHTQIHTIRDEEITQISSGGSLNNPKLMAMEEDFGHPLGYMMRELYAHKLNPLFVKCSKYVSRDRS